jgi:acyl carrier protein
MSDNDLSTFLEIIRRVGGVQDLAPDQDFYDAGVSSVNALPLLIEVEDQFQVSIPDDRFMAARTAGALRALVLEIKNG